MKCCVLYNHDVDRNRWEWQLRTDGGELLARSPADYLNEAGARAGFEATRSAIAAPHLAPKPSPGVQTDEVFGFGYVSKSEQRRKRTQYAAKEKHNRSDSKQARNVTESILAGRPPGAK